MTKLNLGRALVDAGLEREEALFVIGSVAVIEEFSGSDLKDALSTIVNRVHDYSTEKEKDLNVLNVLDDYFGEAENTEMIKTLHTLRKYVEWGWVA